MKKRERGIIVSVLIACVIALLISTSQAAWKYNSGDLWGADNVQDSLDTEEARAKAAEVVNTTSITALEDGTSEGTPADAIVVTNGQAVSLSGKFIRLNSSGSTNLATNTITLPALASGENGMFVVINTGTSNLLAVAQTGTFKSPALELTYLEACVIVAPVSNAFYAVQQ